MKQRQVVTNGEGQYSVWFVDRPVPAGWRPVGHVGTEEDCLDHIARVWTDIRPLGAREHIHGSSGASTTSGEEGNPHGEAH